MDFLTALPLRLDFTAPEVVSFVGGGGKSSALFGLANAIASAGHRVISTSTTHLGTEQAALAPAVIEVTASRLPLEQIARALSQHNHCLLVGPVVVEESAGPQFIGQRLKGIPLPLIDELVEKSADLGVAALLVEADGSKRRPIKAPAAYEPVVPQSTTVLISVMGLDAIGRTISETYVHRPELVRQLLREAMPSEAPNEGVLATSFANRAPISETTRVTPAMAAHLLLHPNGGAKNLPVQARQVLLLNKADGPTELAAARLIVQNLGPTAPLCLVASLQATTHQPIRERWAPLGVAVLAAGQSSRMGRAKQLTVADGDAMVVRALRVALRSGAAQVVVVTGAYASQVTARLQAELDTDFDRVDIVHNPMWESGQASSVRCAIKRFEPFIEAAAIMPVDQPFLTPLLLKQLFQRWRQGAQLVAPTVQTQLRGAPALFDRCFWPEFETLEGDVGARVLLRRHQEIVSTIETSAIYLQDIDTPQDLARLTSNSQ